MPSATLEALRLRARLNRLIRDFFEQRGVLEVETPILSAHATVDRHIESFSTEFHGPAHAGSRQRWLRTSPEFAMKRLLAAGYGDCYELGRVFRNGEAGARHNPEFTLLEWYRVGFSLDTLMSEVADLIQAALALVGQTCRVRRVSYAELFQRGLGIDPHRAPLDTLIQAAGELNIDPSGLTRDDWLDLLITHRLQPSFKPDELLLLHDYPATQAALAQLREVDGIQVAERFEAYLGPIELANGYHELLDAEEQERRFKAEQQARQETGRVVPPFDARLVEALSAGMPACSGVALGVDRLVGRLTGEPTIGDSIAFAHRTA
ncbi:EF-P lysine aminoacylase EpmA [Pseudomarimonas salicorniae]